MSLENLKSGHGGDGYIDGQLLIAMPVMGDERFARTVIYMCAHTEEGAWGIVINRRSRKLTFPDLLVQLDLIKSDETILVPERASAIPVLRGGPVEKGRGFVLHSPEYHSGDSTIDLNSELAITSTVDILRDIANGSGPDRAVMALGYAGWAPGQLDSELQMNGWLTCPADDSFVFDTDQDAKYERALRKIGIDPAMLSGEAGHA